MYGKTREGIGLPPICDDEGILLTQALGGKYADLVRQGIVFSAANQAAVSTTAALATTWTGLSVGNPAGSGVDLELLEFGAAQAAAGVAGAVGLMYSDMTGLATDITPRNALRGGSNASKAIADAGATIATPVLLRVFGQVGSLATTGYGLTNGLLVDLNGDVVLEPGQSILTYTTAACTTAFIFHFLWAEKAR